MKLKPLLAQSLQTHEGNLTSDSDNQVWKLADLGLARLWDPEGGQSHCGTRGYIAPEMESGHYDGKADIYGLGLTFINHLRRLVRTRWQLNVM